MDVPTIQKLKELNNAFYQENHASFSQTRGHAWDGWERMLESLPVPPSTVLDVACGNMRFKGFIDERAAMKPAYYGVDSCAALVPAALRGSLQELDLIDELANGTLAKGLQAPSCDLTVCFGFMHHLPSYALRESLIRALTDKTTQGGTVVVSFWQFAADDAQRAKAQNSTRQALKTIDVDLEEGDYLLGWQNKPADNTHCFPAGICYNITIIIR